MICDLFATDGSDTHGKADQRPRRQRMDRAEMNRAESRDEEGNTLASKIADDSDFINPELQLEKKELKQIIRESLSLLTAKEEKIIRLRFGITEDEYNNNNFKITESMQEYLNEK